jgi:hypothetical protein
MTTLMRPVKRGRQCGKEGKIKRRRRKLIGKMK